jgi:polysaccharide biosynthesis/export protein ExoF
LPKAGSFGRWSRARAAVSALVALLPGLADAADYRLGPQDRIKLVVVEWRLSRAEAYNWSALNGEFTVSTAGTLTLPLVGAVKAEGQTVEQLSDLVSEQLQKRMGLVDKPSASIDVVKFRPFYVTGDVATPGEYPFRPGLTVLKALSIGGGLYRPLGTSAASLERDATLARGDLRMYAAERLSLQAKRARLEAEIGGKPGIDFPAPLLRSTAPEAQDAIREERLIFEARRSSVQSKIASLQNARDLLEKEIAALVEKDGNIGRQLQLAIAERDGVKALMNKGLALSSRQVTTEQNVAQMESARIDAGIARVRAEQDRAKVDRDITDLQTQRRAEILLELRLTEGKLSEASERLATSERLAFAAEVSAPDREAEDERARTAAPRLTIVRNGPDGSREIDASYASPVEPGDVVQVRRDRPTAGGGRPPMARQDPARGAPSPLASMP